jgi:hypothetical protein
MRFLTIFQSPERDTPPTEAEMATMGAFIEEAAKAGWLLTTEGCLPTRLGARVRQASGEVTITDGPFTEAKEVVGGFAIIQASSKEEAIALTRRFLNVAGDGECEIRQLYEAPAFDAARNGAAASAA